MGNFPSHSFIYPYSFVQSCDTLMNVMYPLSIDAQNIVIL